MQKEKREMCQQKFKDFEAIKVAENEQILVMDWKNKNGYSEYSIRYIYKPCFHFYIYKDRRNESICLTKIFFYKICLTFTEKSDKQDPPTSLGTPLKKW